MSGDTSGISERKSNISVVANNEYGSVEDDRNEQRAASLLATVESLKNRGNVEFHKGKVLANHTAGKNFISDACILYAEALQTLAKVDACIARLPRDDDVATVSQPKISEEYREKNAEERAGLSNRADTLRPSLYLNLAACNLLLHEWAAAVACCTEVLELCGDGIIEAVASAAESSRYRCGSNGQKRAGGNGHHNEPVISNGNNTSMWCREMAAKALYRRSSARVGEGDLGLGREDLSTALKLKPGDANIRRELKKVEKHLAEEEAKAKLKRETEEGRRRNRLRQEERPTSPLSQAKSTTNAFPAGDGAKPSIRSSALAPVSAGKGDPEQPRGHEQDLSRACQPAAQADSNEHGSLQDPAKPPGERKGGEEVEPFPTKNGGECRNGLYAWNQSVREVQVSVKVPDWVRASNVRVDIGRSRLAVAARRAGAGESDTTRRRTQAEPLSSTGGDWEEVVILAGPLSRPVQVGESVWTLETPGSVLLYLQKELPTDGEPGFEWWATVMEGDEEIDVLKCDAGSDTSQYPEHARRRGAKALWDYQQKTPEERREEELDEQRMREAKQQMEEEVEERQRNLANALKDPNKAEMYRKLREVMPDTPISMK